MFNSLWPSDAKWHQAITWINVNLSSMGFCSTHFKPMSQKVFKIVHHWIDMCLQNYFNVPQGAKEFTHWGRVTHICIGKLGHHWFRQWHVACSAPSHYLDQCCLIVNGKHKSKLQWNLICNSNNFIEENMFENVVCQMVAILSWPQWAKRQAATPKITITNFNKTSVSAYTAQVQFTTLRLGKMAATLADDIFKCISLNENFLILNTISLKYVP